MVLPTRLSATPRPVPRATRPSHTRKECSASLLPSAVSMTCRSDGIAPAPRRGTGFGWFQPSPLVEWRNSFPRKVLAAPCPSRLAGMPVVFLLCSCALSLSGLAPGCAIFAGNCRSTDFAPSSTACCPCRGVNSLVNFTPLHFRLLQVWGDSADKPNCRQEAATKWCFRGAPGRPLLPPLSPYPPFEP